MPIIKHNDGLSGEDWARADFYALLSVLYAKPIEQTLLSQIAQSAIMNQAENTALGKAWDALIKLASTSTADQWIDEYNSLFVGVGKPDILLNSSYFLSGFLHEKPLAHLRDDLHLLGLGRSHQVYDTEDHISFLCEVMRYLITSDSPPRPFEQQSQFFHTHIASWVGRLLDVIDEHPQAHIFKTVSQLTRTFFEVEQLSFDFEV